MKNLILLFLYVGLSYSVLAQSTDLLEKAEGLIENEEFIEANDVLDELISKDSTLSKAFSSRARCLFKRGKYEEAISDLHFSLELDSLNTEAYCGLGSVYSVTKRFELAMENFNRALEIDSLHLDSYNSRGALKYFFLHDFDGALQDFNKALFLDPDDDYTLYNRGILYNQMDRYQDAYVDLSRSIELKGKQSDVYYARGQSSLFLGNYLEAIKDFKKTIKYNKPIGPFGIINNGEVIFNMGFCYQELGKTKKAEKYFAKASKLGYEQK